MKPCETSSADYQRPFAVPQITGEFHLQKTQQLSNRQDGVIDRASHHGAPHKQAVTLWSSFSVRSSQYSLALQSFNQAIKFNYIHIYQKLMKINFRKTASQSNNSQANLTQ